MQTPIYSNDAAGGQDVFSLKKPFNEKYTLTVTTDLLAGSFPILTKAEIRWSLRVVDVEGSGAAEIELITIDNQLLETNNPNFHDIAALNRAFARMYAEIRVKLDANGKVLEVVNLPTIIGKWNQTKAEMQKISKDIPAIETVVQLNDETFADPDKVKVAVENNEFFKIYRYLLYGVRLPADKLQRRHNNLFNSTEVNWEYKVRAAVVPNTADSIVDFRSRAHRPKVLTPNGFRGRTKRLTEW